MTLDNNGHALTKKFISMRSSSISAKAMFILRQDMTLNREHDFSEDKNGFLG